ncbi:MAG: Holliday junction resolvase RuvX [Candidatus Magasanikbacteria bacterium]|nr:Holliday junction resolvase RuvX [Candidatus Magasanikbacteria bacterium]
MLLGLDYGEKNIGLAVADENSKMALPYKVLINKGENFVLQELKKIIIEEKISKIIVGLPLSLSGAESKKTIEAREFSAFLAKNLDIPVEMKDERLSSRLADAMAPGAKNSRDIGAAMIILESYLV